jgi:hypothetical protein
MFTGINYTILFFRAIYEIAVSIIDAQKIVILSNLMPIFGKIKKLLKINIPYMTTPKSNVVKYKNNESSAIIPNKIIKNMKTKVIIIYLHNILFLHHCAL